MPLKSTASKGLLFAAVCIAIVSSTSSVPQAPNGAQFGPPSWSSLGELIAEAGTADTKEGNEKYAKHLTYMFVARQTGDAYVDEFSSRLSLADLMVRHGKAKWIPEGAVVQAFNYLMEQTGGSFRTDAHVVHQIRITLSEVSPALSTVQIHGSECLPSEAVSLTMQLLERNGSLEDSCPPEPDATGRLVQHACVEKDDALVLLTRYLGSHCHAGNRALYEHVAQLFSL